MYIIKQIRVIVIFLFFSASQALFTSAIHEKIAKLHQSLVNLATAIQQVPSQSQQPPYATLSQWKAACDTLKYWAESKTLPDTTPLTFDVIQRTLEEFMNVYQSEDSGFKNKNLWLDSNPLPDTKTLEQVDFKKVYAQKLTLPAGSIVALHGDLHGDIHSLLSYLEDLKKAGYIDDTFKIINNNFYIIFLGDYVDRGHYGIEVLYTIMRLKIANPSQCIIVRGNHEDISVNLLKPDHWFAGELAKKFPKQSNMLFRIALIYKVLPAVLYLGSGANDNLYYFQCCHGGMELGYLPNNLLRLNQKMAFEWITKLERKTNYKKLLNPPNQLSTQLNTLNKQYENFYFNDFSPDENLEKIGFLWSDFALKPTRQMTIANLNLFSEKKYLAHLVNYIQNRGWVYGQELTSELLKAGSEPNKTLVGVIRGHQHADNLDDINFNMMPQFLYGKTPGVVKLWQDLSGQFDIPFYGIKNELALQVLEQLESKNKKLAKKALDIYLHYRTFMFGYQKLNALYQEFMASTTKKDRALTYKNKYDDFSKNMKEISTDFTKKDYKLAPEEQSQLKIKLEGIDLKLPTLWQDCVVTFNVSPDTSYNKDIQYGFDTYGVLTLAETFDKCSLSIKTKGNENIVTSGPAIILSEANYKNSDNYWFFLTANKQDDVQAKLKELEKQYAEIEKVLNKPTTTTK